MADNLKVENVKKSIFNTGICIIAAVIVGALIWRIQCSISYYDETLNIYISYMTAALGQRHLVENGYIFSMGDVFNLPFVYLFWRITGGTEGLLLFIRFVYLGFNLLLSFAFWKVFGKFYGKQPMILFGLILITFFPEVCIQYLMIQRHCFFHCWAVLCSWDRSCGEMKEPVCIDIVPVSVMHV